MTLHEYQKQALRTCPPKGFLNTNADLTQVLHGAIGISGEVAEIIEDPENASNVIQEIGDVMWYVAILLDAMKLDMNDLIFELGGRDPYQMLVSNAGKILDKVKRAIFYNVDLDTENILTYLCCLVGPLEVVAHENNTTLEECCKLNIDKLRLRYPNKYSDDLAVNRDVAKEQEVFK